MQIIPKLTIISTNEAGINSFNPDAVPDDKKVINLTNKFGKYVAKTVDAVEPMYK